jgi:hypothetical protein
MNSESDPIGVDEWAASRKQFSAKVFRGYKRIILEISMNGMSKDAVVTDEDWRDLAALAIVIVRRGVRDERAKNLDEERQFLRLGGEVTESGSSNPLKQFAPFLYEAIESAEREKEHPFRTWLKRLNLGAMEAD